MTEKRAKYATSADFGKLFSRDMTSLYQLSYLLTANSETAEQCFIAAFKDCAQQNTVFQNWARPFSRRTVVHNPVRMMSPHPGLTEPAAGGNLFTMPAQNATLARILALGEFQRFVFVLSSLERYPIRECATVLGCSWLEIDRGRIGALQQIANLGQGDVQAVDEFSRSMVS